LAVEKLAEQHGLTVSDETLLGKGVTHFRRRKRPHQAIGYRTTFNTARNNLDGLILDGTMHYHYPLRRLCPYPGWAKPAWQHRSPQNERARGTRAWDIQLWQKRLQRSYACSD
jgi:hypothetical protein